VQSITAVVDKMKAAGTPVELFMYAHCGHAFMNALTAGGREKIKGEGSDTLIWHSHGSHT
jgi:acetyl esterase/lipase